MGIYFYKNTCAAVTDTYLRRTGQKSHTDKRQTNKSIGRTEMRAEKEIRHKATCKKNQDRL